MKNDLAGLRESGIAHAEPVRSRPWLGLRALRIARSEQDAGLWHGEIASAALLIIAVLGLIFFLKWAKPLLVPIAFSVLLALSFNPIVGRCARYGVPRAVSAMGILLTLWGSGALMFYSAQDNLAAMAEDLPIVAERIAGRLDQMHGKPWPTLQNFNKAAQTIERATNAVTGAQRSPSQLRVQIESSATSLRALIWSGWAGALAFLGELLIVTFLTFFMLTSGPTLRRKLVRNTSRTLSQRRIAIRMLDAAAKRIQSTLLALTATNILYGILTGIAFAVLGLNHPVMWGMATALAHFIPYFGAFIIGAASLAAGLVQFTSWHQAIMPAIASFVIATIVGNLVAVWIQGRSARMDAVSIFIGMLVWGWLWGPAGFIIAAPLMALIKAICEHAPPLSSVAGLMEMEAERPVRVGSENPSSP